MEPVSPFRPAYRFGGFELDPRSGELKGHGETVRLQEQPLQFLLLLLARPGEIVTREEMRRALWPEDTFVAFDVGLNSAAKRLRDALHDSADNPRFVETLPRRGYRLNMAVEAPPTPPPEAAAIPSPSAAAVTVRRWVRGWPAAAAAVAAVIVVAAVVERWRAHPAAADIGPVTSLAVLPFRNLTGDPTQEYLVQGLTEALTTQLAQIRALRVSSRTSAMQYDTTKKPLPLIARELDVAAVLEGAVARSGDRVRVTAQLVHVPTDRHLWARSYDREMRDVPALQREVSAAVVEAMRVEVRPDERRRLSPTVEIRPEAYEAYLQGRYYWNQEGPQNLLKAAPYFQQAITLEPRYAAAYAGLAATYRQFDVAALTRPRESMPKAEAAARKALALDDTLADAHVSLATILRSFHWDWDGAMRENRRALELDPGSAEAHRSYAVHLLTMRRHEEALPFARRAYEMNPLSSATAMDYGVALARLGRHDEAIEVVAGARLRDPRYMRANQTLAFVYTRKGDPARALAVLDAKRTERTGWVGYWYGTLGRTADARAILRAHEERARRGEYVQNWRFALLHFGLGNRKEGFAFLEKALFEEREIDQHGLSGVLFDLLHDDPRYREIIRRMGLFEAYFPDGA